MKKYTKQRGAIREVFKNAGNRLLSVNEVWELSAKSIPNIGIATVYRNIKDMVADGNVKATALPGQFDRYSMNGVEKGAGVFIMKDGTVTVNNAAAYYDGVTNFKKLTYFIEK
jgi:Fe2+ or Zn2+ uptake regulation protein